MSREAEIFEEACGLPLAERGAFLERACIGDATLKSSVEDLLAGLAEAERAFPAALIAREFTVPEEQRGDAIGRYHLLERIGEGGCGVVWMAEQQDPVRRRVALKVIKLGMDTKAVIARFEAERQALALMDHPNIARIFDAGATETGRPFFVMELVHGTPITRFCDEARLPIRRRLELFIQVCLALQHAHDQGIVHRDIKPSNILVAQHDDMPVPKVIDFGIAKATQGPLTDATAFTAVEQFIGTPAYMSPEQADLGGRDVNPRSDIYSLGVLLYELLTGRPPFDPERLRLAGLDEIRRIIREVEPAKPSVHFGGLAAAEHNALADLRSTAPAQLSNQLRGDLDWIVIKSLEKDRARRYESADAFAADIRRLLNHEPIAARPPGAAYVFGKFVRRHRLAFVTVALVLVGIITGTAVSVGLLARPRPDYSENPAGARPTKPVAEKSIAVLPFKDLSPDPQNAFFADGVHEDTLSHLFNIRELIVRSRTSVEPYRSTGKGVREIGAELGVAYLLEGSLRRVGSTVHLTAQLVDARTDVPRWSKVFDRDLSDIFAVQAELAKAIAAELRAVLSPQEKMRVEQKLTENPLAFDLYLRARESFKPTAERGKKPDLVRAETLYRAAVELDPKFASAWADLSRVHGFAYLGNFDHTPARLDRARAALETAVQLDPNSPTAIWAQADFYYNLRDWERSRDRYEALARLQPNHPDAFFWHWQIGASSRRLGRWLEAVAALRKATEIDPENHGASVNLVRTLECGRRYDEADAEDRRWLRSHPNELESKFGLARRAFFRGAPVSEAEKHIGTLSDAQKQAPEVVALLRKWTYLTGQLDEYLHLTSTALTRVPKDSSDSRDNWIVGALVLFAHGETAAARARLSDDDWIGGIRKQLAADSKNDMLWLLLAKSEALLGNREEALRCLDRTTPPRPESYNEFGNPVLAHAHVYALAGEKDRAIAECAKLLRAAGSGCNVYEMKLSPTFVSLRGDPRFEALLSDPKNNAPLF